MSSMSELDLAVRNAELDGIDYFPVQVYVNPAVSDRRDWAIFDVKASQTADYGIAFVTDENDKPRHFDTEQIAFDVIRYDFGA